MALYDGTLLTLYKEAVGYCAGLRLPSALSKEQSRKKTDAVGKFETTSLSRFRSEMERNFRSEANKNRIYCSVCLSVTVMFDLDCRCSLGSFHRCIISGRRSKKVYTLILSSICASNKDESYLEMGPFLGPLCN